jgi:hypothetical protein
MPDDTIQLWITLALLARDKGELTRLARQLKHEIEGLRVESVESIREDEPPAPAKVVDWTAMRTLAVTLSPLTIPSLFDLLKRWSQAKTPPPVRIRVRFGRRISQVEYDPTQTTVQDLNRLVRSLAKTIKF